MITKKSLRKAIEDLGHDQFSLAIRVYELEKALANKKKVTKKPIKRGRGRPRKNA